MKRVFGSGRYANVVSTLALIVALGGTSYAAIKLPANSVGSKQIKKGGVANSDIRSSAVTSSKVRDGSLLKKDFAANQLPAGPTGPAGATGATGPAGPVGPAGSAVGYAAIKADGSLDTDHSSANITSAMVANASTSASCFHGLPFTVHNAVAVAQYDGGAGTNDEMVQVAISGAGFVTDCNSVAGTTVEVAGYSGGNYARVPFFIWFT